MTPTHLRAWRIAHPAPRLRRTAHLHSPHVGLGFVALPAARDPLDSVKQVVFRAAADRTRAHASPSQWSGTTWIGPVELGVNSLAGRPPLRHGQAA